MGRGNGKYQLSNKRRIIKISSPSRNFWGDKHTKIQSNLEPPHWSWLINIVYTNAVSEDEWRSSLDNVH